MHLALQRLTDSPELEDLLNTVEFYRIHLETNYVLDILFSATKGVCLRGGDCSFVMDVY